MSYTGWKKVETVPVTDFPIEGVEVNRPVKPEIIERGGAGTAW